MPSSATCARRSQIARNVSSGVYLREAIKNLDGTFTTKRGNTRRLSRKEIEDAKRWDKFFERS